jgi:hypothetical protein
VNVATIGGDTGLGGVEDEEWLNTALLQSSLKPDEECRVLVSTFLELPPKKWQEVSKDQPLAR